MRLAFASNVSWKVVETQSPRRMCREFEPVTDAQIKTMSHWAFCFPFFVSFSRHQICSVAMPITDLYMHTFQLCFSPQSVSNISFENGHQISVVNFIHNNIYLFLYHWIRSFLKVGRGLLKGSQRLARCLTPPPLLSK